MSLLAKPNFKTILCSAVFGIGAFSFTPVLAECHYVSCPNGGPQMQNPHHVARVVTKSHVIQDGNYNSYSDVDTSQYDDANYKKGYKDGMRAAGANGKTRVVTKIVYKKAKSSGAKHSAGTKVAINRAKPSKTYYSKIAHKSNSSSRTYYSQSADYGYNVNGTPMRDRAYTYGAGNGVSYPAYAQMGRGESWQRSDVTIVRYATPHVISNVNGRACGWGTPIASNGQYGHQQAYVCQCAQGWLPPR